MSKTTKTILIVVGVILLCCCVVGIAGYIFLGQGMSYLAEEMIVDDPLEIQQVSGEIAEYDLPAGYQEEFVMNILGIKSLFIINQSSGTMIMMVQFSQGLLGATDDLQEQFQESFMQQYNSNDINFSFVEERSIEINGQQTAVQVFEGSDSQGYDYIQWITIFNGDNGTVMLMIVGSANTWNDAEMENFLSSID